jgi:hypothetical protein
VRRPAGIGVLLVALAAAPAAHAQDSDAPPGALPHWLPNEAWVYQHWLPYDEGRLYRLLGASRGEIWRHLRNDAEHDLAQLARRRGRSPERLAAALVAPRAAEVSPVRLRVLRERALRTLTQGHLSQHILFHSLHQTAVPDRAAWIFGVGRSEFLRLRRAELSPLQIGRLHGRSTVEMHRRAEVVLRAMARRGVREQALTPGQARLLLDRQLRQVPRWLGQSRYNGPPQTSRSAKPLLPPADFAANPTISGDGRRVVWDAYRATIPEAVRRGEISVVAADLGASGLRPVSHAEPPGARLPRSAYNAAVATDGGAVVYEAAEGNMNFAKRYGEMQVLVCSLDGGATTAASHLGAAGPAVARTAYNPSVSADGRVVAFEASDAGSGGGPSRNGLFVLDRATGRERLVTWRGGSAVYEPRLTGDGRAIVFTAAAGGGHALVHVRALATGATTLASRADGARGAPADADAHEPSASADGSVVAFTSSAANLGRRGRGSRVYVRDLERGTTEVVGETLGGHASEPALSADGRHVAFVVRPARPDGRPRPRRSLVWLHDRATGATTLVSRRDGAGGGAADGASTEPAVSADGRRVAFSSTASNLHAAKPGGVSGVFVRDLVTGRTRLLSTHAPLGAPRPDRGPLSPLLGGAAGDLIA